MPRQYAFLRDTNGAFGAYLIIEVVVNLRSVQDAENIKVTAKKQEKHIQEKVMCKEEFDEKNQYGMFAEIVISGLPVSGSAYYHIVGFNEWCYEARALAKKWLQKHIDDFIPETHRKQVGWIVHSPQQGADHLTRNGIVGWKYSPTHEQRKLGKEYRKGNKTTTKPLVEGTTPNEHNPGFMKITCDTDCSKVDYCILFSSAPVGGTVYFKCPKKKCVNWHKEAKDQGLTDWSKR